MCYLKQPASRGMEWLPLRNWRRVFFWAPCETKRSKRKIRLDCSQNERMNHLDLPTTCSICPTSMSEMPTRSLREYGYRCCSRLRLGCAVLTLEPSQLADTKMSQAIRTQGTGSRVLIVTELKLYWILRFNIKFMGMDVST